ncbi:GIY-YIG catalytic domain-containing endonuclease [Paramecium bursaria Chlorella virus CviKI]|nr:GIY-YIG catalytic domain-containing endonuclease [Paramecium bursaria Chlorella virus CviKI]
MGFIYILISPNTKKYVGQTLRDINIRFKEHKTTSCCIAISRAIQKYGWENIKKQYFEWVDDWDLDYIEMILVEELETLSPKGYNLREGGGARGKLSEETKKKIGDSRRGKELSEETKTKISDSHRGKHLSEETKTKISDSQRGTKLSEETKRRIGIKQRGKKTSEETKRKMRISNKNSKQVYQYKLDGTFIQSFSSCSEAARYLEKRPNGISKCAIGNSKYAYGFVWSYEEPMKIS